MLSLLPPLRFSARGYKPDFVNWVEMYAPKAGPDLSFSVSKGVCVWGVVSDRISKLTEAGLR